MGAPNCLCLLVSILFGIPSFPDGKSGKGGGVALHLHFPTGKYQKQTDFPNGKFEILSGIETTGNKLGAPSFPSQFPMN